LACTAQQPTTPPATPTPPPVADIEHARPEAIYFVLVDRFSSALPDPPGTIDKADPQAFHGGDIDGVTAHLDHIADLGFTAIWLSPVWEMRTEKLKEWGAFHGYWVRDLASVEPRFGDEAALRKLSDELHKRDMRLYLDIVWNHVSFDSPLREQKPSWFHPSHGIEDWDDPIQRVTHEVHGLPDLAQENPEVEAFLSKQSLGWIDRVNPDGFRVDAVRHMPLDFQKRMGDAARSQSKRDFRLIGEVFDGDPIHLQKDWAGGGFDHVFDFPLRYAMIDVFCKGAHPGRLGAVLTQDHHYADAGKLVTMLDNHDLSRVMSECGGDINKVGTALQFLFSTRGIPSVTYGTEVGLEGMEEPANRADMRFEPHFLQTTIRQGLDNRAHYPALADGQTIIEGLSDTELQLVRVHETGAVRVFVRRDGIRLQTGVPAPAPVATSTRTVIVTAEGLPEGTRAVVTGSGLVLGNWNLDKAPALVNGEASFDVPVPGVVEVKLALRGEPDVWQDGANHYRFIDPGPGPVRIPIKWAP